MFTERTRELLAFIVGAALLFSGLALSAWPSKAEPVASPVPPTATPLPTVQMDGIAWQQLVWGDTVFVGGAFANARPAGAAPGTAEVPRANLLAFDLASGELRQGFVADTNGQVLGLAMAPDGSRLYVAGEFTSVNGSSAYRIAALDPVTGAVDRSFKGGASFRVRSLLVTDDVVYAGGQFNDAGGQPRANLAAFRRSDGAVLNWAPQATGGQVMALAQVPGSDRIAVAGAFTALNGVPALGSGAVDPVSGATMGFPLNQVVQNSGSSAAVYSLHSDGSKIYGTGYTFGGGGNFEGTFAVDGEGRIAWVNDAWGDHYDMATSRGVAYAVSHVHNDANLEGGIPEVSPRQHWYATASTADATGVLQPSNFQSDPAKNFAGQPAPTLLHWWPEFTTGDVTEAHMAGWTVEANDDYVVIGGEFLRVGTLEQQGIVRFTYRDIAPSKDQPRLAGAQFVPEVTSPGAGVAQVSFEANWDRDDAELTYQVQREGVGTIGTLTARSNGNIRPVLTHLDRGLPAGTYRYRVRAIDGAGLIATGDWVSVDVAANGLALSDYAASVLADSPNSYRRLGEPGGTVVDSGYTYDGGASSGVDRGVDGAIAGDPDTAYRFSGSGQTAWTYPSMTTPREVTTEAWFKTTTNRGGAIVGWGNRTSSSSSRVNYVTYLGNDGRVRFGVRDMTARHVIVSPQAYNDGQWHHVAATLDWYGGQRLYVDGELVASDPGVKHGWDFQGYWRAGGDSLGNWPDRPSSDYLSADLDEVATYRTALPADRVLAHYQIGTGQAGLPNQSPVASFELGATYLDVSVDGSGSSDPDGAVVGYAWDFGDGATGEGKAASHTYAAAGTYTIGLTVTDDRGATGTATRSVTVTEPPVVDPDALLVDDFGRTVAAGWGAPATGPAWSVTGDPAGYSVTAGTGQQNLDKPGAKLRSTSAIAAADVDITTVVSLDADPTGGGVFLNVGARSNGGSAYLARVKLRGDGSVVLNTSRFVDGTYTALAGGTVPGMSYTAGQELNLRMQVTGSGTTAIRAKIWPVGEAEPADWFAVASDTTAALQGTGDLYLEAYLSSSATTPVTARTHTIDAHRAADTGGPNESPVASFELGATYLDVSVDGSGSSDPDGAVVGYAWDFGDGATGEGKTASHTYAAAGTYTIGLTVTDDRGATGTATRSVTVTEPPVVDPDALLVDDFGRTVAAGWGVPATGPAWSVTGDPAGYSVTAGTGQQNLDKPGAKLRSTSAIAAADVDITTVVSLDADPTGGGVFLNVGARSNGGSAYLARVKLRGDGSVVLNTSRFVDGTYTALAGGTVPGMSYTAGQELNLRMQVTGSGTTAIRAKIWPVGEAEPADWFAVASDTTAALQGTGDLYLEAYLSSSATTPVTARTHTIDARLPQ